MAIYSKLLSINAVLARFKAPAYYRDEARRFIFQKGVTDFQLMTSLPLKLRQVLSQESGPILSLTKISEVNSQQAHKVLFACRDGNKLEAVRMLFCLKTGPHQSLCLSSQSGCALGCKFCATGRLGFNRNLTSEEISDQLLFFKSQKQPVKSVSFMGMGEPLANADNVIAAIKIITDPDYFSFSPRRISLSTVGIIPGIRRLTSEFSQINLAFSLHSPFPQQRLELMPISKTYPVKEIFPVLDEHIRLTNKRVFVAYVLLAGINDSVCHARELVKLLKARGRYAYLYHVNLIRFNPGSTLVGFQRPQAERITAFRQILLQNRISHTLRQSFGADIAAACGQLAGQVVNK